MPSQRIARFLAVFSLAALLFRSTNLESHLRAAFGLAKEAIQSSIPIELELARLGELADELRPEIEKARRLAAELQADVELAHERLRAADDVPNAAASRQEAPVRSLDTLENPGESHEGLDGRALNARRPAVERRALEARLRSYQNVLEKLSEYTQSHDVLVPRIDLLKAELQLADSSRGASRWEAGDALLGEIRRLHDRLERRIRVQQRMAEGGFRLQSNAQRPNRRVERVVFTALFLAILLFALQAAIWVDRRALGYRRTSTLSAIAIFVTMAAARWIV